MKRRTFFIAGLFLMQIPVVDAQGAQSLYEQIRTFTVEQFHQTTSGGKRSERTIEQFIPKVYPKEEFDLREGDIDLALRSESQAVCSQRPNGQPVDLFKCQRTMANVQVAADRLAWLRGVVRDWQLSAAGYEAVVDNYPGRPVAVATRLPSISTIWQSDGDIQTSLVPTTRIRGGTFPEGMQEEFDSLHNELYTLRESGTSNSGKPYRDLFVAAVWRYRDGYSAILEKEGQCGNSGQGDGTELQHLRTRWCPLENALEAIHQALPPIDQYEPPLGPTESVMFPVKTFDDLNVYVWIRHDDVGLGWNVHTEPVLPSLNCGEESYEQPDGCKNGAILGGEYPEEPEDPKEGTGLCSHPIAKRGYLCREYVSPACLKEEQEDGQSGIPTVRLIDCKQPNTTNNSPSRVSLSGPDVCRDGGWYTVEGAGSQDTPQRDLNMEPNECDRCVTDVVCGGACGQGGTAGSVTKVPGTNRVEVCIAAGAGNQTSMVSYNMLKEMVRAQQACSGLERTADTCCALEYQASLVMCNALGRDGMLEPIGYDIETCATAFANLNCGGNVCGTLPQDLTINEVVTDIRDSAEERGPNLGLPASCAAAVQSPTGDIAKARSMMSNVCDPTCEVSYINSIGNNLCYVGQCLEQSLEEHRLIPGRSPFVVQGESFHVDANSAADPNVAEFAIVPTGSAPALPPYRPKFLVQQLDLLLCQLNGLPAQVPPTLCAFNPLRRLTTPPRNITTVAQGLADQPGENEAPRLSLQQAAPGIAARVGNELFLQYLRTGVRSFEELLRTAGDLLHDLETVNVPAAMCPRV